MSLGFSKLSEAADWNFVQSPLLKQSSSHPGRSWTSTWTLAHSGFGWRDS